MQLIEEHDEGLYLVRAVTAETIQVGERIFSASLLLTPQQCLEAFPVRALSDFTGTNVDAILELQPALVVIGTGSRQQLPAPVLMASFLRYGVGLETMDNGAAARTFNLLASEGRRVVAVFLL